jgi:hypothetical protein
MSAQLWLALIVAVIVSIAVAGWITSAVRWLRPARSEPRPSERPVDTSDSRQRL